jgi:hypothetical protein
MSVALGLRSSSEPDRSDAEDLDAPALALKPGDGRKLCVAAPSTLLR